MSITAGFLLLFFTIVIPGFLFLRSYYFGEFSKQFNPKDNITKHLLFGIIPGSIIQIICFLFGKKVGWISIDSMNVLSFFETVNNQKISESEEAQMLIQNPVHLGYYLLIVYGFSFLIGMILSRLIRASNLDKRWKMIRFKNQWYYIFSGEIFDFKKFKSAANILGKASENGKKKIVELSKVHVLISNGGENEFYSGYVVDYDLLPSDPSKLDNLYLMDAYRHSRKEIKNDDSQFTHPRISEKKPIPGEIFVLNMCNLVNINVSYLLSEKGYVEQNIWVKRLFWTTNLLLTTIILVGIILILFRVESFDLPIYQRFHKYGWWLDKLLLIGVIMSIFSFPISEKSKETGNYQIKKRDILINTVSLFVFSGLFYIVYWYL